MSEERNIAIAVMRIAAAQANSLCTFKRAYQEVPNHLILSPALSALSVTRPGEPMWHQIVRNIKSHDRTMGNFIAEGYLVHIKNVGYKITDAGRAFILGHP